MQGIAHFGQETDWAGCADEAIYANELSDANEVNKGIGGIHMLNMGQGMIMRNHGGCGSVFYANKGVGLAAGKFRIVFGRWEHANEEL